MAEQLSISISLWIGISKYFWSGCDWDLVEDTVEEWVMTVE